ncbi:MAG TPA: TolC family protein [Candidatus Gastranaerophilales bacterium]|nr:TolC family protein [Candidatus Gastranaerophilales bacterium]
MKMFVNKILICCFFIWFLLAGSVLAEEKQEVTCEKPDICGEIIFDPTGGEYPVTLNEVLTIVLDKNFNVKIFQARKERDRWKFYGSASEWLPDLSYQYFISSINGTVLVGNVLPLQVTEIPIESNFNLGYAINAGKYFDVKEAYYIFNSAKKDLEFTKKQALLEVTRNYYTLLREKLNIKILETNIEQIKEQLRINKEKLEAGVGTNFDVLRAKADLSQAQQRLIAAKNLYRLAQAQLANNLGVPVLLQLVPNDNDVMVKEIFEDCFTLEQASNIALKSRPDLAAQNFDIEAKRQRKNAAYSVYIPEVSVIGQLSDQGTTSAGLFSFDSIGIVAQWRGLENLGLKGYTDLKVRKAELEEAQYVYINESRNIQENLVRSYFNTIAARELIKATNTELESATESRRLAVLRLESGVGTFIDVLQTQNTYTESRINNLRSIIGYNISQVELLFEMGVISSDNILCGYISGAEKLNPNKEKADEYNKRIKEALEKEKLPYEKYKKPEN